MYVDLQLHPSPTSTLIVNSRTAQFYSLRYIIYYTESSKLLNIFLRHTFIILIQRSMNASLFLSVSLANSLSRTKLASPSVTCPKMHNSHQGHPQQTPGQAHTPTQSFGDSSTSQQAQTTMTTFNTAGAPAVKPVSAIWNDGKFREDYEGCKARMADSKFNIRESTVDLMRYDLAYFLTSRISQMSVFAGKLVLTITWLLR